MKPTSRTILAALTLFLSLFAAGTASAHPPTKTNLPPTKATPELQQARTLMDTAKQKLMQAGKFSCCIKAPAGSKVAGCDLCARVNGSCNCAANLIAGKGVCGDCLGGWKAGKGAIKGVKSDSVTLLDSSQQKVQPTDAPDLPELVQARELLNNAKRILVKEGRFACCVGKGGCDECAYEAGCPCGQEASEGRKGDGICGQCYDGWHAGIGRLAGLTAQDMKMQPMSMDKHDGMMAGMKPFAGVSMFQEGSGTAWQPSNSPMFMQMKPTGRWNLMTGYNAHLFYDRQEGQRGDYQFGSTNWGMAMARRDFGKDQLQLRAMLSLDALTVTPGGYPLLSQSGESYGGKPLVDRQHPHDFVMELAARYRHPLGKDSGVQLYLAPVGEPALGPVAFPHRVSAMDNPVAPITHHWLDSTHISYGVATLGAWKRNWQIEGSYFTGREPDEKRFEFDPFRFGSYSTRLTYNPGPNWSLQASYGYLHSPESLRPTEDLRRTTFSASWTKPRKDGGFAAVTFAFGNNSTNGINSDSYLLEGSLNLASRNTFFGRMEYVNKLGEELALTPADKKYGIGSLTLGYVHDFTPNRSYQTGFGAAVTLNTHPSELDGLYGSSPAGYWLFVRIRPAPMKHHAAP